MQTSGTTYEVLPCEDIIEHTNNFWCLCNPSVEAQVLDDEVYWVTTHNSLDEFLEDSQA